MAIVLVWGVPALIRTNGEFFWVGIGRHVVERSFGALEGHGGQTWSSYFITLPFYFGTGFLQLLSVVNQAAGFDADISGGAEMGSITT